MLALGSLAEQKIGPPIRSTQCTTTRVRPWEQVTQKLNLRQDLSWGSIPN